jgi:hypothetical protein
VPRASSAFDGTDLRDEDLRKRIERLGRDAVMYANIEPEPSTFESDENVGAGD